MQNPEWSKSQITECFVVFLFNALYKKDTKEWAKTCAYKRVLIIIVLSLVTDKSVGTITPHKSNSKTYFFFLFFLFISKLTNYSGPNLKLLKRWMSLYGNVFTGQQAFSHRVKFHFVLFLHGETGVQFKIRCNLLWCNGAYNDCWNVI